MEPTEWRPVVGYEDIYRVSSKGEIQRIAPGTRAGVGHVLKPSSRRSGHLHVSLCKNGTVRTTLVHRIVAFAFLGAPPADKPMVCHADGDPSNNAVENLRWDSSSGNYLDALRHGTSVAKARGDRASHCSRGHEFTPENTYIRPGRGVQYCRRCAADRARGRRLEVEAAIAERAAA